MESNTNSSLTTFRDCPRKFENRYIHRLQPESEHESEALAVGSLWHLAHEIRDKGGSDAEVYDAIAQRAPNELWGTRLAHMFAAYEWYWGGDLKIIESESRFRVELEGFTLEGVRDGVVEIDGRRGILERKTTSDPLDSDSVYWNRLRLDTQTPIYFLAARAEGWEPEFILYDVVRKPTTKPKRPGVKKEREGWMRQINAGKPIIYFQQTFDPESVRGAIEAEEENLPMYGARLTAEIGNDPGRYFQRRPIYRTGEDFQALIGDLVQQLRTMETIPDYWRNPGACDRFGRCEFAPLCWRSERWDGTGAPPDGFRQRTALHPELES